MTDIGSYKHKKVDRRRNSFHLVFVPKYRYNLFKKVETKEFVEKVFRGIALEYGLVIYAMEVVSNHVHLFVELPAKMCVWHAIRLLKSLSAKAMFQRFQGFRMRYPKRHLWNGYAYYESIGKVTASKIEKYIKESQSKHEQENKRIKKSKPAMPDVLRRDRACSKTKNQIAKRFLTFSIIRLFFFC